MKTKGKMNYITTLIIATCLLLLVFAGSILLGEAKVNLTTIFEAIFHYNPHNEQHNIIAEIRIPRDIGAILVGISLATAGAVIQGVTKCTIHRVDVCRLCRCIAWWFHRLNDWTLS